MISNRKSRDLILNARGKRLINFLSSANLSLLNSSVVGEIFGEYTSVNYNGQGVVDYMATTSLIRNHIKSFRVMDLTKFSYHKPCVCAFNHNIRLLSSDLLTESLEDAPRQYNWRKEDQTQSKQFHAVQNEDNFHQRIANLVGTNCATPEDAMKLNSDVISIFQDMVDAVLPRRM